MSTPAQVVRFGVFELHTSSGELRRHGLKIRLPDQSFQILKVLLSRRGEVVTRDELRHVLWTSDTFVDFEVGLNSAVRKLREALDDSAENPRFVETLPRRGYRFVAPVTGLEADSAATPAPGRAAAGVPLLESVTEKASSSMFSPPPEQVSIAPSTPAAITPRRARLAWWRVGVLLLALLAAAGLVYRRGGLTLRPGPVAAPIRSIVVLPFENLIGDSAQDYFVDSVTDAVTVYLAQIDGLDVISRTTALQYRQTRKRLAEIGRELPVDGVVSGTVVRSETGVRITVQLSRAATDRVEWGTSYEGEVSHMLPLQQRIAAEIAVAAGQDAPALDKTRSTRAVNPKAYDAYVKGLTAKGQQRHDGYRTAVAYFDEAVAIQPDFAEAYAAMAMVQVQFLFGGPFSPRQAIPKAEAAARQALQLDPTLAEAHRAMGQILSLYHWQWDEGDKALRKAAELQGGFDHNPLPSIGSLMRRRRFAEAVVAAERSRALDPLSLNAQVAVGTAYCEASQYDRAISELRRALEMSPGNNRVHFQLGVTFVAMRRLSDAIRELESAARTAQGHNSRMEAYLGYAYAAAGRTRDARAVLQELEAHRRDQYVSWFGIALIHDALGESAPALAALQRAAEDRAVEFGQLVHYPPFKTIAAEPAFHAVMREVGLPR